MHTDLLIADADAELRELYERLSFILHCHVETAADALDCWHKLRRLSPDVLLIDVQIPWGGGDGVVFRLREDLQGAALPIVFVTGTDPPEILSRQTGVPAVQCFQKPFRLSTLLECIGSAVAAGRF